MGKEEEALAAENHRLRLRVSGLESEAASLREQKTGEAVDDRILVLFQGAVPREDLNRLGVVRGGTGFATLREALALLVALRL